MSALQFALYLPLLLLAFSSAAGFLYQNNCRSRAVNETLKKTLEATVDKNYLASPLKFSLGCAFIVHKTRQGQRALFWKTGKTLDLKMKLSKGVAFKKIGRKKNGK